MAFLSSFWADFGTGADSAQLSTSATNHNMEIRALGKTLLTLTQLLHQLLIFVEFLQSFYVHVRDVNCFGLIAVLLVPQQTD